MKGTSIGVSLARRLVVCATVVLFVFPVAWLIVAALDESASSVPSVIPRTIGFENFRRAAELGFFSRVFNSVIVASSSVLIGLAIASTAAFAFVHFRTRWTNILFSVVVISFLLPFEALSLPLTQVFSQLGLLNTMWALVIPGVANGLAIYNVTQAYFGIPSEIVEAARIDGATPVRIYRSIYLPLGRGALIGSGVIIFGAQWNAYLWPLLAVTSDSLKTAPVAIAANFGDKENGYGVAFAEIVVLALIPLALILVTQKSLTQSFVTSGMK